MAAVATTDMARAKGAATDLAAREQQRRIVGLKNSAATTIAIGWTTAMVAAWAAGSELVIEDRLSRMAEIFSRNVVNDIRDANSKEAVCHGVMAENTLRVGQVASKLLCTTAKEAAAMANIMGSQRTGSYCCSADDRQWQGRQCCIAAGHGNMTGPFM
ncbi:hypothetical protein FRX31_008628 [Thalictrum thalictroides]|uniref:Uncharacterized protein n=1 Tax=Thalictrum thalictroides TaxID=46969 RepID=A0A7J6WYY6_THATH|nr:hypothetical protein FRX31_008628 [Thalictrum thalictroides]